MAFLGPAISIEKVLEAIQREKADLVGVSYCLPPETGECLLMDFAQAVNELRVQGVRFAFGATPSVAERALRPGFFERIFDGSEPAGRALAYLKGQSIGETVAGDFPGKTIERIQWRRRLSFHPPSFWITYDDGFHTEDRKNRQFRLTGCVTLSIDQDALEDLIHEHQKVMAWYDKINVPVELNEPHHWGMRDEPDVIFVVSGFLSAYNARAFGVKKYIAQMMFNSPHGTSEGD